MTAPESRAIRAESALRSLELLDREFSLFTIRLPDGRVELCVQDENCERRLSVKGSDLADALAQAGTVVALEIKETQS